MADLGVKNIFAIVQFSRYGQATGVTVLAAQTNNIKVTKIKSFTAGCCFPVSRGMLFA